jgi:hypothetical protein
MEATFASEAALPATETMASGIPASAGFIAEAGLKRI